MTTPDPVAVPRSIARAAAEEILCKAIEWMLTRAKAPQAQPSVAAPAPVPSGQPSYGMCRFIGPWAIGDEFLPPNRLRRCFSVSQHSVGVLACPEGFDSIVAGWTINLTGFQMPVFWRHEDWGQIIQARWIHQTNNPGGVNALLYEEFFAAPKG